MKILGHIHSLLLFLRSHSILKIKILENKSYRPLGRISWGCLGGYGGTEGDRRGERQNSHSLDSQSDHSIVSGWLKQGRPDCRAFLSALWTRRPAGFSS